MVALIKKTVFKIKASSLIEIVVAMLLLSITLGMSTIVYNNILTSTLSNREVKAWELLKKESNRIKKDGRYLDEKFQQGELIIERKIYPYKDESKIKVLELCVYDDAEILLAHSSELILIE